MIDLNIFLPHTIFYQVKAIKIIGEGLHGRFAILPKHADFVTPIVASVLMVHASDKLIYIALDSGLLVKTNQQVKIVTRQAVLGDSLDQLNIWLNEISDKESELEKEAKSALEKLEINAFKQFAKLNDYDG